MQKFLSFSDSVVTERMEMPAEYSAYLEKCWDVSERNRKRALQEIGNKVIVFHER